MRTSFIAAGFALLLAAACAEPEEDHNLAIDTSAGERHLFTVELAIEANDQERGLMFRERLAESRGMLFLYEKCDTARFWMKNTYIPLDMIFVEADGRIAGIADMTEPESLAIHQSSVPVNGVLEIAGGLTQRLGIEEGDYVRHPWFGEGGKATCG